MTQSLLARIFAALILGSLISACDQAETTSAKNVSRWQVVVDTNATDGYKTAHLMVAAENLMESQKDRAALVLTCEDGSTDVYVIWRQYLGTYDLDVTWRIGSGEEMTELWSLSTDNEAIFAPEPVKLIKNLMMDELFLIKTAPFGSGPVTLVFNTAGLEAEIADLGTDCGW